jgi:Ethanolamine utilization protein EutJ (predicted chaperonin)
MLVGNTNQCRARFKITFGGNIGIPAGGTAGPIQLAIAIDGEAVPSTTMVATPTAASTFTNIFSALFVDVPRGTTVTISVKNTGDEDIDVEYANLIVERVA